MSRLLLFLFVLVGPVSAQPFSLETFTAGLGGIASTNGAAVADYDGDGDLDLFLVVRAAYVPGNAQTWSRLLRNDGTGTFTDVTIPSGIVARSRATETDTRGFGYEFGASWGDYDNDGDPDLFLAHLGPDQLFRNEGNGTFLDVTEAAGVAGTDGGGLSAQGTWFDYDRDGDLDLYVARWWDYGPERDLRNALFRNEGDGTFADVSEASGTDDHGATWAAVAFDADLDGWLDLYLATDIDTLTSVGPNKLLLNRHDGTFADGTVAAGLVDDGYGMGLALADADRNGLLDIYLTNVATESRFQRNPLFLQTTPGHFENVAEAAGVDIAGWGWGTTFFDLESDGDEDLIVVTGLFDTGYPTYVFRSRATEASPLVFDEVAMSVGMDDLDPARSVVAFDYDGDADLDVLVSNVFRSPFLYANHEPQGHWLQVSLEGTASNRNGFGTTVTAWVDGVPHLGYHHGAQFLAQNITPVHLGLGGATVVDSLVVAWPSGTVDRMVPVAVDQRLLIREGVGIVVSAEDTPEAGETMEWLGISPNPVRGLASLRLRLVVPAEVVVEAFDVQGRRVHRQTASMAAGTGEIMWAPGDLAGGVYLVRVSVGEAAVTRRVIVAR